MRVMRLAQCFFICPKLLTRCGIRGLLYKMEKLGIKGNLLSWFRSYLSNRKQKVVLGGSASDLRILSCGVPQGSVLGPLRFFIYVNDIVESLECDVFLFAYDVSLFRRLNKIVYRLVTA